MKSKVTNGFQAFLRLDFSYFLRGGFWLFVLRGGSTASSFLLSIAYAHFLSKEVFGEYKYVLACAGVLGTMSLTGMSNAVISAVARKDEGTALEAFRTVFRWSSLILIAGLAMTGYYLWHQQTVLAASLLVVALSLPVAVSIQLYEAVMKGRGDFKSIAYYSLTIKVIRDVAIFIAVVVAGQVLPLTIVTYILPTVLGYFVFRMVKNSIRPEFSKVDRKAIRYGTQVSFYRAFDLGTTHLDNLFTFWIFGPAELATYAFVKMFPNSLGAFSAILQPLVLKKFAGRSYEQIRRNVLMGTVILALSFSGVVLVYYFAAPYLFQWLFPKYTDAIALSRIYCLKIIPNAAFLVGTYFYAKHQIKRQVTLGIIVLILRYSAFASLFVWRSLELMVYIRVAAEFAGTFLALAFFLIKPPKPTPSAS